MRMFRLHLQNTLIKYICVNVCYDQYITLHDYLILACKSSTNVLVIRTYTDGIIRQMLRKKCAFVQPVR